MALVMILIRMIVIEYVEQFQCLFLQLVQLDLNNLGFYHFSTPISHLNCCLGDIFVAGFRL